MKKYKIFSIIFASAAVLLSDVMCAVTAYNYCSLRRCEMCSAPPSTAFLTAIPFLICIAVCVILSLLFMKKQRRACSTRSV